MLWVSSTIEDTTSLAADFHSIGQTNYIVTASITNKRYLYIFFRIENRHFSWDSEWQTRSKGRNGEVNEVCDPNFSMVRGLSLPLHCNCTVAEVEKLTYQKHIYHLLRCCSVEWCGKEFPVADALSSFPSLSFQYKNTFPLLLRLLGSSMFSFSLFSSSAVHFLGTVFNLLPPK